MADGSAFDLVAANEAVTPNRNLGERGKVGTGTAGSRLKNRWQVEGAGRSLKDFARFLDKDEDAVTWRKNKGPSLKNAAKAARAKNKGARIAAEKLASKAARKK